MLVDDDLLSLCLPAASPCSWWSAAPGANLGVSHLFHPRAGRRLPNTTLVPIKSPSVCLIPSDLLQCLSDFVGVFVCCAHQVFVRMYVRGCVFGSLAKLVLQHVLLLALNLDRIYVRIHAVWWWIQYRVLQIKYALEIKPISTIKMWRLTTCPKTLMSLVTHCTYWIFPRSFIVTS